MRFFYSTEEKAINKEFSAQQNYPLGIAKTFPDKENIVNANISNIYIYKAY